MNLALTYYRGRGWESVHTVLVQLALGVLGLPRLLQASARLQMDHLR